MSKINKLNTLAETKFLSLYNAEYSNKGGNTKNWTIASRQEKKNLEEDYLNNKEKSDVFYDERPVWIQGVDEKRDIAKVGFVDNFEEKDVYIEDLYEKDLFN